VDSRLDSPIGQSPIKQLTETRRRLLQLLFNIMLLENKYAVISGAATKNGIGYATARRLAEHGATVAILDLERNSPQKKSFVTGATIDVNGGMYIRA
jgi:hypothetical protein